MRFRAVREESIILIILRSALLLFRLIGMAKAGDWAASLTLPEEYPLWPRPEYRNIAEQVAQCIGTDLRGFYSLRWVTKNWPESGGPYPWAYGWFNPPDEIGLEATYDSITIAHELAHWMMFRDGHVAIQDGVGRSWDDWAHNNRVFRDCVSRHEDRDPVLDEFGRLVVR